MPYETYEYIFSGLAVFLMISVSLATVFPIAFTHLRVANAFQLQTVARSVLDKLLISPGYPFGWGTDLAITAADTSRLQSIGLGSVSTLETLFRLDANKFERLVNTSTLDNPYYVPPSIAASKLGLQQQYGFSLSLKPVLNITATLSANRDSIIVKLRTPETIPVANVNVTAIIIRRTAGNVGAAARVTGTTDWNGTAVLIPTGLDADRLQKSAWLILADYNGIRTATVGSSKFDVVEAVLIGNNLVVQYGTLSATTAISNSQNPLYVVGDVVYSGKYATLGKGTTFLQNGKTYATYALANLDADVTMVAFVTNVGGTRMIVVAFRPWPTTYATGALGGIQRYTLTRVVEIVGIVFRLEFHLWRLAE